jgi:hypothetical protein
MSAHFADCHAVHSDIEQGLLDFVELERLYEGLDLFNRFLPSRRTLQNAAANMQTRTGSANRFGFN